MDSLVIDALAKRLDEIEESIKHLEAEYKAIAAHINGDDEEVGTRWMAQHKKCKKCGHEGDADDFRGWVCKTCLNRQNREYYMTKYKSMVAEKKAAEAKKKKDTKTLDEVIAEARAHGMNYGEWVAEETKRMANSVRL